MTIAAGFKCSDGILLASDTLYSGATQRVYGRKLWILHSDNPVVVFGGAAQSVAALTRARHEIQRKIQVGDSLQRTLDKIDTALQKVNQKFGSPGGWPDVQALVVIRAEGQNLLFHNDKQQVALSPVDLPTTCVGVDALGSYFTESLFRDGMTLSWARSVAAHLVWNCKKYASGYCGGDTHLVEIPNTGGPTFLDDQVQIAKYEQDLHSLVEAIDKARTLTVSVGIASGSATVTGYAPSVVVKSSEVKGEG